MAEYDNSKSFLEWEMDKAIDQKKEHALAKHSSEIRVMDRLINSIDEYLIRFGRESNVYDLCFDLKKQIEENKKHTQEYMDKI